MTERMAHGKQSRLVLLQAAIALTQVDAHSWVACTDYRGDVNVYEEDNCFGYPRLWANRGNTALTATSDGYHIGTDTGYNYMPGEPCQSDFDGTYSNYNSDYPRATYEAGKVYCLAWPMKNHGAATCTNAFIPDTSTRLFHSDVDATSDPTQAEFKANNVNNVLLEEDCASDDITSDDCQLGLEKHDSGSMDCKGFQRSPRFCDNTDRAMGTGCFQAPSTTGNYVFQWYWEFNAGSPYATCFDAIVVAAGAGNGEGGTAGTPSEADNAFGGSCTNNAIEKFDTDGEPTPPTPSPTPISDDKFSGDTFVFTSVPEVVGDILSGDTFTVGFAYTAGSGRTFDIDVVTENEKTSYGGADMSLTATDENIRDELEVYLTSTVPSGTTLKVIGRILDTSDFDDDTVSEDYCLAKLEESVCFSEDGSILGCLGGDDDDSSSSSSSASTDDAAIAIAMTEGAAIGVVGAALVFGGLWYGGKIEARGNRASGSASPGQVGKGWQV